MPRLRCGCWRKLNGLALDDQRLLEVALNDRRRRAGVPASRACDMTGVGETLLPLSLPKMPCVLVNPRVPVATKDVFAALGLRNGELLVGVTDVIRGAGLAGSRALDRRLGRGARGQSPTISKRRPSRIQPVIGEVISALNATNGAWLARMSGSGATCFAIYENTAEAGARRRRSGAITPPGGCMRAC